MQRGSSLMSKLAGKPKLHDGQGNRQWIHAAKELTGSFVVYQARYLGCTEVDKPRGTDVVKDAIKKIQIAHELKKSEAGKKGSKLHKVEVHVSVDIVKITDAKSKEVITQKLLHRISYCADDHINKKVFAFIAKEQDSKTHNCYVVVTEKDAAELTVTVGQAFELAYKRYLEKGKRGPSENKEVAELKQQIALANAENSKLKQKLEMQGQQSSPTEVNSHIQQDPQNSAVKEPEQPALLVDWGSSDHTNTQQAEAFDPFDNYLSKLATSRDLGSDKTPDHINDRTPFQSPLQKNPSENPFSAERSNPFGTFFAESSDSQENSDVYNGQNSVADSTTNSSPALRGVVPRGLPPPPTKQSIKAANKSKMRGVTSPPTENVAGASSDVNRNNMSNAFADDLFDPQIQREESSNSVEAGLRGGLQFDSYALGDLVFQ